jgi:hypothetical protein
VSVAAEERVRVTEQAEKFYEEREKRICDAIALRRPRT